MRTAISKIKLKITFRMCCECVLGLITVTGQIIGSTTLIGALIYESVSIAWMVWMITGKMWGFLPCNIFGLCASTYTLVKVLSV